MFDNHKLGAYILFLRKKHGLTQSRLAELLGVSPQAVSNWERGESMPDIALLSAVARSLGTTADKLLAAAENYDAEEEQPESPDEELERLKSELEETKRRVREAEERAGEQAGDKERSRSFFPSWQEINEKLPNFQDVAENARELGKDVSEKAKEIFDAAQDFTRKRVEQVEREIERRRRDREEQQKSGSDDEGTDDKDEIDFALITSLAPFASQEGVDTMLDNLPAERVKLTALSAVSPFAGDAALGRLTRRVLQAHPDENPVPGLVALAPFLRESDLRDIIMDEEFRIHITLPQIMQLAPFLGEKDIDTLILRAAKPRKETEPERETPERI